MGLGVHIFGQGYRDLAPNQRAKFLAQFYLETKL